MVTRADLEDSHHAEHGVSAGNHRTRSELNFVANGEHGSGNCPDLVAFRDQITVADVQQDIEASCTGWVLVQFSKVIHHLRKRQRPSANRANQTSCGVDGIGHGHDPTPSEFKIPCVANSVVIPETGSRTRQNPIRRNHGQLMFPGASFAFSRGSAFSLPLRRLRLHFRCLRRNHLVGLPDELPQLLLRQRVQPV